MPGLSLEKEIKFALICYFLVSTTTLAKTTYKMTTMELKELMTLMQVLSNKAFNRLVFFLKKIKFLERLYINKN